MGKITIISSEQKLLLSEFAADTFFSANFYFSGGTALSLYYLNHRISVDLDFFSEQEFNSQTILTKLNLLKNKYHFKIEYVPAEETQVYILTFPKQNAVKIDFAFYPYKRLKPSIVKDGVKVDSLFDIAANKLLMTEQRAEVKDFVDLYFLLKRFTIWDLIGGVHKKFGLKTDPLLIASNFLKVESFEYLPKMILPLTLDELKDYFRDLAKKIGGKLVE